MNCIMPTCAALTCTNKPSSGCGKSFHRYPHSKPDLLRKWLLSIPSEDDWPSKYAIICSDHFTEECFDRTGQTIRLRENAVPTLFDLPPHLQKKVCKAKKLRIVRGILARTPSPDIPPAVKSPPVLTNQEPASKIPDHSYANQESPRSLKRKLNAAEDTICRTRKKLRLMQQTTRRLNKKVESLKAIIWEMRKHGIHLEDADELLQWTVLL